MPNIQSAKKRLRQSLVRRGRNRSAKSTIKTAIKRLQASVQAKEFDAARAQLTSLSKLLDQTASKGIIHSNKASRTKSRLSHFVKKAAAASFSMENKPRPCSLASDDKPSDCWVFSFVVSFAFF